MHILKLGLLFIEFILNLSFILNYILCIIYIKMNALMSMQSRHSCLMSMSISTCTGSTLKIQIIIIIIILNAHPKVGFSQILK